MAMAMNATSGAADSVTVALFSLGQQSVKRTAYDVITPTRIVIGCHVHDPFYILQPCAKNLKQ